MNQSNTKAHMSHPTTHEARSLRALVLMEDLPSSQIAVIESAAASCRVDARLYQKAGDLLRDLHASGADMVLVSASGNRAGEVCRAVRTRVGQRTALIGVARQVDGLAFGEFVGWGGDDLVPADAGRSLSVRLRAIRSDLALAGSARTVPQAREDGRFLVMAAPNSELVASARVIEQSGHHAVVVHTPVEAGTRLAVGRDIRVVVDARVQGALDFVDHALLQNNCTGVVLACPPMQLGQLSKRYAAKDRVIVLDSCSPADAVLLAANQLKAQPSNRRSTERLLYSTIVAFRDSGSDFDHVGCTYNVSAGGLYVRTLAMPLGEKVWLEAAAPGSMERVRLEGRVAWRTPVTRDAASPFPVGIGVEITDGTRACLSAWLDGYRSLQSKLEIDPASLPTVRPPSAIRRRVQLWSSMSSGPSASYLPG